MNNIEISQLTGEKLIKFLPELAKLRIQIFYDFPYLYNGNMEYEQKYLQIYANTTESIIIGAFDGDLLIGASTATALINEPSYVTDPFIQFGWNPKEFFYYGESVLKKEYRNQGIGVKFFIERERYAYLLGYNKAVFCAVIRANDHQRRPINYVPLDEFWQRHNFYKVLGLTCKFIWKDLDESQDSEKIMQFWRKDFN